MAGVSVVCTGLDAPPDVAFVFKLHVDTRPSTEKKQVNRNRRYNATDVPFVRRDVERPVIRRRQAPKRYMRLALT